MPPKVSIIVPMFNMEKYIERCAKSLFEQTYQDVEYIFVDDCSQDNTLLLLKQLIERYASDKKVIIECHEENMGLAYTRWHGLRISTGVYLAQVDSDDYVTHDYIERLVEKAENTRADIVLCDFWYDFGNKKKLCHVNPPNDINLCLAKLMSGELHNGLWNKLIIKQLYTDHDIHPIPGVNMFEDKTVMFQLFFFCSRIAYVDTPIYFYNKNNPNSISGQTKAKGVKPAIDVIRIIDDFFACHQADEVVIKSIDFFKVGIKGIILLYGNPNTINEYNHLLGNQTIKTILTQPVVPWYYKVIVLAHKFGLKPIVSALRSLLHFALALKERGAQQNK